MPTEAEWLEGRYPGAEDDYLEGLRDEIAEAVVDELAIDEARDYCPDCGRQALGRVCGSCGFVLDRSGDAA